MNIKQQIPLNILLADDDTDDRFFFAKALNEIPIKTQFTAVDDGDQLMNYLTENPENIPDILFLDLSMPRKTGFECLTEIKENKKWKDVYVVMLSTSYTKDINYEQKMIDMLYGIGAQKYIRKPSEFIQLKQVIHDELIRVSEQKLINKQGKNL